MISDENGASSGKRYLELGTDSNPEEPNITLNEREEVRVEQVGGIADYEVICDERNNSPEDCELRVDIKMTPDEWRYIIQGMVAPDFANILHPTKTVNIDEVKSYARFGYKWYEVHDGMIGEQVEFEE